ncbi:MAG: hypothetical protein AAGA36_01170 [Pseudomonadota bacterium]
MNSPIDIATKGLAKAQSQFAQSAARVTAAASPQQRSAFERAALPGQAKTDAPQDARRDTGSGPGRARSGASAVSTQGSYLPSLAEETVQMRLAANAYAANAKLVRAADDLLKMTQEALSGEPSENEGKEKEQPE